MGERLRSLLYLPSLPVNTLDFTHYEGYYYRLWMERFLAVNLPSKNEDGGLTSRREGEYGDLGC